MILFPTVKVHPSLLMFNWLKDMKVVFIRGLSKIQKKKHFNDHFPLKVIIGITPFNQQLNESGREWAVSLNSSTAQQSGRFTTSLAPQQYLEGIK